MHATLIGLVVVASLVPTLWNLASEHTAAHERVRKATVATAESVALACGTLVAEGDIDALASVAISMVHADTSLAAAWFVGKDGRLIVHSQAERASGPESQWTPLPAQTEVGVQTFDADGEHLVVRTPIRVSGECWGAFGVRVPLAPVDAAVAAGGRRSLLIGGVFLVVGLFGARWLARSIVQPVQHLSRIAQSVAAGDRSVRVGAARDDELGELGRVFDTMLGEIERARQADGERNRMLSEQSQQLAAARDEALQASRAKTEFLANMSHELRTPLNGVIGMTQLLFDTPMNVEQRDIAASLLKSGELLLEIIGDILDVAKLEANQLTLEDAPFRLHERIADLLAPFGERAREQGIRLLCDLASDVPEVVCGDSTRLMQVLSNLIGNALKFTPSGNVWLRLSAAARTGTAVTVSFAVQDSGIGIPAAAVSRLFRPFSQVDGSTTRKYGGTGLGLAISQRLVNMMGGTIRVDSAEGRGSTFHFDLVLRLPGASTTRTVAEPSAGRRTLVIEADDDERGLLVRDLSHLGCRCEAVASIPAAQALWAAADAGGEGFEVVVLDRSLADGLAGFCDTLRAAARSRRLQVVLLGSLATGPGLSTSLQSLQVVNASCPATLHSLRVALASAQAPADEGPAAPARRAVVQGRVLLAEDNLINRRVVEHMLRALGCQVTSVGDGRAAVEAMATAVFELVLMDCQMPVMSGYDATRAIRSREAGSGRRVPIIAITANALEGDEQRCIAAGMDDYLSKPVRRERFEAVVLRHLGVPTGDVARS